MLFVALLFTSVGIGVQFLKHIVVHDTIGINPRTRQFIRYVFMTVEFVTMYSVQNFFVLTMVRAIYGMNKYDCFMEKMLVARCERNIMNIARQSTLTLRIGKRTVEARESGCYPVLMKHQQITKRIITISVKVRGCHLALPSRNYFIIGAEPVNYVACPIVAYVNLVEPTVLQPRHIVWSVLLTCVQSFQSLLSDKMHCMDGIITLIRHLPNAQHP